MRQPLQYVPWALIIVVLGLVVTIVLSEKKMGKSIRPVFSYTFCDLYTCGDTDYFFFQRTRFQKRVHESGTVFHVGIQRGYPCIFYRKYSYDSAFRNSGTALFPPAAADVEMCCTRRCLFGSDGTEPVRDETRVL